MKTIIYTSFPCLVKYGENKEHLSINEHLILEDVSMPIYVYPNGRDKFSFEIGKASSPYYRMIEKDGKRLIFLLDGFAAENTTIHTIKYDGDNTKIEVGQKQIIFYGLNHKKSISLPRSISNICVGHFYHINYVKFEDIDKKNIICYNTRNNLAKMFSASDIILDDNGFSLVDENENYSNSTHKYIVDRDGLKIKEESFARKNDIPPIELIPYKFMCAIKCGDYIGASDMLSHELKTQLDSRALKGFFGDVSYFYMIDHCSCFALSDNKNIIYTFLMENDKIKDIQDSL